MDITEVFPKKLKEIRRAGALTQSELAEAIGVTSQTIYKYENGIAFPPGDKIQLLLGILEVTPNELFWDTELTVLEKIDKLVDDEIGFRYKSLFFKKRFGAEAAENMIKNALKFDESTYPFEDILKFHKWDFENKLLLMIEVYISDQLRDSDKRIEASIEDQRRQSAELPDDYELDLEEYFKDF